MLATLGLVTSLLSTAPPPTSATLPGGLRIRWEDGQALLRTSTSDDASMTEAVLSVVGPMVSLRRREDSAGANRWYTVDRLVVRGVPGGFDLDRWLEESGQRAGLEAALPPLDDALGPRGFAVVDSHPDSGLATLEVEVEPCDVVPSICELATTRIMVRPPPAWRPWLAAARAGRGVLGVELAGHVAGIDDARARRTFGRLWSHPPDSRVVLLGRRRGRLERVEAGVDDQWVVRVRVWVDRVLYDPGQGLDEVGRVSYFTLFTSQREAPGWRRDYAWLGEPGQRLAVVASDVVETARAADLVPLTRRARRMLAERYPAAPPGG